MDRTIYFNGHRWNNAYSPIRRWSEMRGIKNTLQIKPYYKEYLEDLFVSTSHQDIMPITAKTFLTEIIQSHDPRPQKLNDVILKEINGLLARKT